MENRPDIPVEALYRIFGFLAARDLVRLRTVSKQFRDISYEPEVWRLSYTNACVPRPPGPFPSQPAQFLERTLMKSEQLAQTWTTQPMRCLSSVRIRLGQLPRFTRIIHSKWLIGCESSRKFVAYDLDSKTMPCSQQVLWEHDGSISEWDASPAMSDEGPVLYIVFRVADTTSSWKLLEFRVDSGADQLCHPHSFDVPKKRVDRYLYLHGDNAPFLCIGIENLIFHVGTRQFYEFPPVDQVLDNIPPDTVFSLGEITTYITKTHIIALRGVFYNKAFWPEATLIQAFTLPPESYSVRSGPGVLRLSHEGLIHHDCNNIDLIRNSIVDPINGGIKIRFLRHSFEKDKEKNIVQLSCVDLTLAKHAPSDMTSVLPITIDTHNVLEADDVLPRDLPDTFWTPNIDYSDDGYVRGFWHFDLGYIVRFTIDASRERCTCVLGKRLPVEWYENDHPGFRHCRLDGMSGKLCYDKGNFVAVFGESEWEGPSWPDLAVVVDIE